MNFNLIYDYAYDHLEEELVNCDGIIAFDPTLIRQLDSLFPCEIYANLILELYEIKQSNNLAELLQCARMSLEALVDMMFLDDETVALWAATPTAFDKAKKHIAYHIFLTRVLTYLDERRAEALENN